MTYLNFPIIKSFVRFFSEKVDSTELVWHLDENDRLITVVSGIGWKLQIDNELPIDLFENSIYHIPKETYHRILKSSDKFITSLVLKVEEF